MAILPTDTALTLPGLGTYGGRFAPRDYPGGSSGYSYYRFDRNDIFVNTVELFPQVKFLIYSGTAYYNDFPNIAGVFADPIRLTSASHLSLYELNIDRASTVTGRTIGPTPAIPPGGEGAVNDTGLIYPYIIKDGSRLNLRTSTSEAFENTVLGAVISGAYPLTASIAKELYDPTTPRHTVVNHTVVNPTPPWGDSANLGGPTDTLPPPTNFFTPSVSNLFALKRTIDYYRILSPHFEYSSSLSAVSTGVSNRDFNSSSVGLISIPQIIYGSEIQRGTINLEFYYTGTLLARAEDSMRNGELIQTYGPTALSGAVVGIALYNEGFLILTSSTDLSADQDYYTSSTDLSEPRWVDFAAPISGAIIAESSSFVMSMSGTTNTEVITMFATAPKGELNHSNNPSYLRHSYDSRTASSSMGYREDPRLEIKNVVSSAYNDPTGSFEKTTYISRVALYDNNKNLIGFAKTATPIKKTVERDFTYKLKLDI